MGAFPKSGEPIDLKRARMRIKTKLALSFGVLVALSTIVGGVGFYSAEKLSASINEIGIVRLPSVQGLLMVESSATLVRATNATLLIETLPEDKRAAQLAAMDGAWKRLDEGYNIYAPLPQTEEEAVEWTKFVPAFDAWKTDAKALTALIAEWQTLAKAGKTEEADAKHAAAQTAYLELGSKFKAAMDHFGPILKINMDVGAQEVAKGANAVHTGELMIVVGGSIAIFLGLGLAFFMSRDFNKAVRQFGEALDPISRGDLTHSIDTSRRDEFGVMATQLHTAMESVRETIAGVSMSSQSVAAAATQIAASAEEMSQTLKTQEHEAQQVSAAVSQMSASVVEVARKSGDAANNAKESGEQASAGGEIVRKTVDEMTTIDSEVTHAAGAVEDLAARSETIGKVIGVINDIAEQTNLLALNAAIEAARAGEHGRGFAVVADEVRKLAERTSTATKEVATTVQSIQVGTRDAVEKIKACTTRVQDGVKLANQAGGALERIVQGSGGVQAMVASIAAAAEEQSAASDQVARSIQSITASSQESAQAATQAAQAAANLSQQSETLRELVLRFKV